MVVPERERKRGEIRPPCLPPEVRVSIPPVLTAGILPSDRKSSSPLERITSPDILTFVYVQITSDFYFLGWSSFSAKCSCRHELHHDRLDSKLYARHPCMLSVRKKTLSSLLKGSTEVCRFLRKAARLYWRRSIINVLHNIILTNKTKRIRTSEAETWCSKHFSVAHFHSRSWIRRVLLRCRAAAIRKLFRTTALHFSHLSEVQSHPRVSQAAWL